MNINVKRIAIAGVLMVGAGLSAASASASAAEPTLTLQQALQERISGGMRMPVVMGGQETEGGIARVAFVVGADGRTHDVTISRRSGSTMVDREALRLISSFRGLPPGIGSNHIYAVLQYGTSGEQNDLAPRIALASQVALARTDAAAATRVASALPSTKAALAAAALATVAYTVP